MSSKAKKPVATKPVVKSKKVTKDWKTEHAHLFSKNARVFKIGQDLPPTRDLTRFVKWPQYVRLQRQRAILKKRLKVPPAINQFSRAIDKNQATNLFRLLSNYRPESKEEKKKRLTAAAAAEVKDQSVKQGTKPMFIKYGLNHITDLVETKKAKLVVIAHDVDPIELVVWLPALCRKLNVPYVIVKGKARLGHLVYKKTASVLAVTDVRKEDQPKLDQLITNFRLQYNDDTSMRRKHGGGTVGIKAQHVIRKREKVAAKELASKGAGL
jgi:large subunit ribosomal protein L7Ae